MKNVLIVFATKHGQTRKIAEKIEEIIRSKGLVAVSVNIKNVSDISLDLFDGVLFGTPVYLGKTDGRLTKWIYDNKNTLSCKRTGAFIVALNSADFRSAARKVDREILIRFMDKSEFTPGFSVNLAGALNYLEYNPIIRFFLKRISRSAGGPTNTEKNYDLTDWIKVSDFTEAFISRPSGGRFGVVRDADERSKIGVHLSIARLLAEHADNIGNSRRK